MKLRTHLVTLVLAALLPMVAFSIVVVVLLERADQRAVERGLGETARALARAVDHQLDSSITTLAALAESPLLDTGHVGELVRFAARVVPSQAGWRSVFLADPSGRVTFNTISPSAESPPSLGDREYFRNVVATRQPAISNLLRVGGVLQLPTIVIAVPVVRHGALRYVLSAALDLPRMSEVFRAQSLPPDWTGVLLDRKRTIIGGSRTPERYIGRPATPTLAARSTEVAEGAFHDVTKEGGKAYGVFSRAPLSGFTVVIGIPARRVALWGQPAFWIVAGAGVVFALLAIGLATRYGRRITAPIRALAEAAAGLERGEGFHPSTPSAVLEVNELATALADAAAKQQRAEEWLRITLTSIGDAVIATDVDGRVTFMNHVAQALTGFTETEARGRPLAEVFVIVDEDTRHAVESPVARVIREGRSVGLANHTVLVSRDGRQRPIDDSGAPIRSDTGGLIGVVLVFHDVTERRRVEGALRESEARFRVMADTAPVLVWVAGVDGTCTFFNKPWLDFTGRTMEQELAEGWAGDVHPEDRPRCLTTYETAFAARRPFRTEHRTRRADGEYRWVLGHAVPRFTPEGEFAGYVGSCVDITERRLIEDERARRLREETAAREEAQTGAALVRRLQAVTDAALSRVPMGDLLHDVLGRIAEIVRADAAAILLLDTTGDHLVGRAARGLDETREVRVPVGRGFAGRIAAERRPAVLTDVTARDVYDRRLLEAGLRSLMGVPLLVDGRITGVLHVGTLTSRHFTEDDVDLLQLVADRAALAIEHTLLYEAERRARAEAEAASRAKDDFLATLSHELRTPLNAVLGWARMLRRGALDTATATRAIEVIERNAFAQTQLINDLLDVSRIITGRVRLDLRPLDFAAAIEAARDSMRPAADAKEIVLETALDPAASAIVGDPDRLQQVVWNLLSNAVKFTPSGGRVRVALQPDGGQVILTVADTGLGIAPDVLPYVFDRFRQADSTTTRSHGGLGLGLAIVRHLVELHGGTVEAASAGPGRGTTFTLRLPRRLPASAAVRIAPAALDAASGAAREPLPSLRGARLLVVDDEADARDLLRVVLERCGAEVTTAESAAGALAALGRDRFDALLSDVAMPGEDGYDLIRRVRRLSDSRGGAVPAIALTAYARLEDRDRALAAGYQRHVAKPVEPVRLAQVVAEVMDAAKASR